MIPDIQRVVADFLRDHGYRAVTKPPSSTQAAWVRVHEIAAPQAGGSTVDEIVTFEVQIDCYAGADAPNETHGQPEANDAARSVRELLLQQLVDDTTNGAQVSAVRISNQFPMADEAFKPARDRWILQASITARSLESGS